MGEVRDRYPYVHQLFTQIVCLASRINLLMHSNQLVQLSGLGIVHKLGKNDVYMMLKVIVITIPYQTCLRPRYWKAQRLRFL